MSSVRWRETAMLILLLCMLFCGASNGEYRVRCGNGDGLSFVEAKDGVHGRYRLEWCMQVDNSIGKFEQWVMSLHYNTKRKPEDCLQYKPELSRGKVHSYFIEDVTLDLNCTNVCFSTHLDLIFNGTCYSFKTHLRTKPDSKEIRRYGEHDYVYYVYNNYSKDSFANSQAVVTMYFSGEHVVAHWFLNLVPATDYTMELCPSVKPDAVRECIDVTNNCSTTSPNRTEIGCQLWPPSEPYTLVLKHNTPWSNGISLFENIRSVELSSTTYIVKTTPPTIPQPAAIAPWWALGVVLALALAGGAVLLAYRRYRRRKAQEHALEDARARKQDAAKRAGADGRGGGGRILLLYARDCAPMMAVASQLRALLQHSADHVYDLYSAEVVREVARAPGEWLRRAVARADVRVVLLQSPAAACLHAPALRERGAPPALQLEQPLLNRRVLYRTPHSSDNLLPLALRLMADTAYTTHSYKKFYLATIYGLEAELLREVTPLRRYSLPAAAELLLRDLCDGALQADGDLQAGLQRFSEAVQDLRDHVRADPDYLDEELIFFDYD